MFRWGKWGWDNCCPSWREWGHFVRMDTDIGWRDFLTLAWMGALVFAIRALVPGDYDAPIPLPVRVLALSLFAAMCAGFGRLVCRSVRRWEEQERQEEEARAKAAASFPW